MLTNNLALVSEVPDVEFGELTRIAAALQKQITRDFVPIWKISASISAFSHVDDVPVDYWVVSLCYSVPEGSGGHRDADGRPAAFVEWTDGWSLSASHEVLEMLVDPWGKRLVAGPSVKPGQGRVEYLVEVSDPCQASACAYTVNGEKVSDFYTPHYFDPVSSKGVRYSFSGKITQPRQVLKGGYLSWFEASSRHWWQAQWYKGNRPVFVDCGELVPDMSFRAQIDAKTGRATRPRRSASGNSRLRATKIAMRTESRAKSASATLGRLEKNK